MNKKKKQINVSYGLFLRKHSDIETKQQTRILKDVMSFIDT